MKAFPFNKETLFSIRNTFSKGYINEYSKITACFFQYIIMYVFSTTHNSCS